MLQGQKAMQQASKSLPPIASHPDGLHIYFLTGKKYLYQTLFCIASLVKVTDQHFHFILIDDGTFNADIVNQINQQLPGAKIVGKATTDALLTSKLPVDKYPVLNKKREVYPHIKKLTDVHFLVGDDWKLILDSDMLFWREPSKLISWLKKPDQPLHMLDCKESYGYNVDIMAKLRGHKIPDRLNVGIIGLNSRTINWDGVEQWIVALEAEGGASYYLEQALSAMLVAGQPRTILNADDYKVNPVNLGDGSVLHHYVDVSKKIYLGEGWKALL